jgi:hypothetical protein
MYKGEPIPECRGRRYVAYQVDYALHTQPADIQYLHRAELVWEYAATQLQLWRSMNVSNVHLVSGSVGL